MSHFLSTYGYGAVFLLVALESLGLPVPGETALLAAAAAAGRGRMNVWLVIVVGAAGAIAGDACGYWIGRRGGLPLVRRYGHYIGLDEAKLARARQFYARYGGRAVFFGRFIAVLRIAAAMLAGITCMPYSRFTFYNASGGICWAAIIGFLGYRFGQSLPQLERAIGRGGLIALIATGMLGAAYLAWRRHRPSRPASAESAHSPARPSPELPPRPPGQP